MKIKAIAALVAVCGTSVVAQASAPSRDQMLLEILYKNNSITKEQYEQLSALFSKPENSVSEEQLKAAQEAGRVAAAAEVAKSKSSPTGGRVVVKDGLGFESNDGNFTLNVGGRVQFDSAYYNEDHPETTPATTTRKFGDGTTLRRARILIQGTLYKDWAFKTEYDFARNAVAINDAWVRYSGFKPFGLKTNITAGNFKVPFSLEDMMNTNDITFIERAMPVDVFTANFLRRTGIGADLIGSRWTYSAGVFGETIGNNNNGDYPSTGASSESDAGWSFGNRVTLLPWASGRNLVHVGASAEYRNTDLNESYTFSEIGPESRVTNNRLVSTGALSGIDHFTRYGTEFATVFGPFSLQGEWLAMEIDRKLLPDLQFDGWYVQGSWFLTGDSRAPSYDRNTGKFLIFTPDHQYGAVELAARYSTVDLNDAGLLGGDTDLFTVGLNWYLNKRIRLMANYTTVLNYNGSPGNAGPLPFSDSNEPSAFTARAQVVF